MSGPGLDLEKPNAIGGLDKLVTNFALSVIAVFPTIFACLFTPWKLTPLLKRDDPDGRMGMLLAPGAYFPLCLMVAFIVAATLATPETIQNNGAFIGPDLAVSVQSAASRGEIWRIIGTIMPIYGTAIIIGLLGVCLKHWAHEDWNLRVSLRAAFYVLATLISWLLLVSAAMDLMRISTGNNNLPAYIYILLIIPTCSWIIWIYYWFFQDNESLSKIRSFALGIGMFVLLAAPIVISDILMRLQS